MKKLDYKFIKEFVEDSGYLLISKEYFGNNKQLILCDVNGYYYVSTYSSLKSNKFPIKFSKYNPYTIQNIKLWCDLNNKPFKLISNEYKNNTSNLKWQCLKDDCGEFFLCSWSAISQKAGCGVCAGKQVGLSNCLATKNPLIVKQWHPTKNGDLTPYDITSGSDKKVWWQCDKSPNHEWMVSIYNRSYGYGCPYCAGQLPSDEYNLFLLHPEICEEWHFNKNKKHPKEYTPKSGKKVWWICKECNHEWMSSISHRSNNRGCPECNKSKGEKRTKEWLDNGKVYYQQQKEYLGLVGLKNKNLSYDFYLPDYNLLIEYQGEYHDGTANNQTEKEFKIQKEHDKRKKEHAQNNKIKLLEIWYYDFDNIEDILDLHIKRIPND